MEQTNTTPGPISPQGNPGGNMVEVMVVLIISGGGGGGAGQAGFVEPRRRSK